MYRIILFSLLLLSGQVFGQNYNAVKVLGPESFYLNSAMNMSAMKTRTVKAFRLPPNTVKWYYTFSASRDPQDIENLQNQFSLLSKVSYAIDQTGTTAGLIKVIGKPPGSNYCDVFLLSNANSVRPFENKSQFYFNREGSRENFTSGTVEVSSVTSDGQWQYLGFRNSDMTYGINIFVEVVAIVKEDITTNGWSKEQKNDLYSGFMKEFRKEKAERYLNNQELESLVVCMVKKFINSNSPEQTLSYAEYELKEIFMNIAKGCDEELGLKLDERENK